VIHYWWQVKRGVLTPLNLTVILGLLLAVRPVLSFIQKRKTAKGAVSLTSR